VTDPFFRGLADYLQANNPNQDCDFFVVGAESSVDRQQRQVDAFITGKVRAVVLCPCDGARAGKVIRAVNRVGIPVFTLAVPCTDPLARVVCHVGTDEYAGGREAARAMITALGTAGGKVAVVDYQDTEPARLRLRGFKEEIDRHNSGAGLARVTLVHEQLGGSGGRWQANVVFRDLLGTYADLAGIFAVSDTATQGARGMLVQSGKAGSVKLVGFGEQPVGGDARRGGSAVIRHPEALARELSQVVAAYLHSSHAPPEVLVAPVVCSDAPPVEVVSAGQGRVSPTRQLLQQSDQHARCGAYAKALTALRQAVQTAPTNADAHNSLAWLLLTAPPRWRDACQGLAHARLAVDLSGGLPIYRNTLGVALYRNGRFGEAVPQLEKSLQAGRGQSEAYDLFFLAMCHHQLGDVVKARDEYEQAARSFAKRRARPPDPDFVRELTEFQAEAEALLKQPPPRRPDGRS
jgi:ribose transport system substrate-binding protein